MANEAVSQLPEIDSLEITKVLQLRDSRVRAALMLGIPLDPPDDAEAVIGDYEKHLGMQHHLTLRALDGFAFTYRETGDNEQVKKFLTRLVTAVETLPLEEQARWRDVIRYAKHAPEGSG
jgi:lipopolysaccharide biosynthesis regulator YciM